MLFLRHMLHQPVGEKGGSSNYHKCQKCEKKSDSGKVIERNAHDSSIVSICILVFVIQNAEVTIIAAFTNQVMFHSLYHSAAWFVGMCTVAEPALFGVTENLWEIVSHFLLFKIYGAKTSDSWCINNIRISLHFIHFREGGRVHSCIMNFRQVSRTGFERRGNGIDN